MTEKLLVPDIGEFDSVEIVEILVKPGDKIKRNDSIVTLESDKSSVEVPSTEEGVIESIKELDPMNTIPVYPDGEIRYAIEVNRGWFAENGIEVGDIILEDTEETEIDLTEVKDKKGKGSGTKDACYHKVKSRYSVWPSAYASGALVKCRKVGAANWGNSRKEEVEYEVNEQVTGKYQ